MIYLATDTVEAAQIAAQATVKAAEIAAKAATHNGYISVGATVVTAVVAITAALIAYRTAYVPDKIQGKKDAAERAALAARL